MSGVSVSGSRYLLDRDSERQKRLFIEELYGLYADGVSELHHGDAMGADAFAHQIAVSLGMRIVVHPPENNRYRAFVIPDL